MILREAKVLKSHGIQYIPDISTVELTPLFRGRPEISSEITTEEGRYVSGLCPTGAISATPFSIDLGKCVFCKECEFAISNKIRFTNDYKIAANKREALIIEAGSVNPMVLDANEMRKVIRDYFGHALKLRQVSAAGDNACEMELNASGNVNFDLGRYGIEFFASPRHCDGVVITGPVSENMAEPLQICYDAIPEPKLVILVGTDAISGGIFIGSKALNRSFLSKYPVDLYVPGNPVHPLTFINGILSLIGKNNK
ncbi:MAG: NADH:ubiquinone oxidoreductase [Prevotellaceae bacterium]|jgi:Ni,Fe-hydrogenase III small subunit|nr:NADH:ubiquinone oxidoreductase [Prevotellaceae bacterium]